MIATQRGETEELKDIGIEEQIGKRKTQKHQEKMIYNQNHGNSVKKTQNED